jgi:hypothetical protein
MIQHHIPTTPGRFSLCQKCGHEPRHIAHTGRSTKDGLAMIASAQPARHSLECRCGRTTMKYPSLLAAEQEWGIRHSQMPLALPAPKVTSIRRRQAAVRKEVRHG